MKRQHYFLITFISLIIIILIYCQDILPLRKELAFSYSQEKKLTQQLRGLYYQEMLLEGKMADIPGTKTTLSEWQKKFIKQDDINKLIGEIIAICKRDKLQIKLFNAGLTAKENNYTKQPLTLILSGNYGQISRFVEQIANLPWTVMVGDFALSKQSEDENYLTQMELYIYYHSKN